jgi:uncharacterized protein YcbK (DUF882 family)
MGSSTPSPSRLQPSRRALLGAGVGGLGLLILRPARAALPTAETTGVRRLTFENLHTGERLATDYWTDGTYQTEALGAIAKVLRDHRTNDTHLINTSLLDTLNRLHARLEITKPFHIISGYRSPASNAKLAAASHGVARKSLHMEAMAVDIRVPGVDLKHLHAAAKSLGAGGVGYYGASNFVHVDVGRVRYW